MAHLYTPLSSIIGFGQSESSRDSTIKNASILQYWDIFYRWSPGLSQSRNPNSWTNRCIKHTASKDELADLIRIADRDLRLAEKLNDDNDWQFAIAYNAVLQLATILIRASGYRVNTKTSHHWVTLTVFPEFLGETFRKTSDYFNECRVKRNSAEYKISGDISLKDALHLIHEAKIFKKKVLSWLENTK